MGCDNQLPGQVTLVLGGAASGKSRYAQRLAEAQRGALLYVATARADDDEMAQRIERHRQARGDRWQTLEVPCDLAGQLPAYSTIVPVGTRADDHSTAAKRAIPAICKLRTGKPGRFSPGRRVDHSSRTDSK